MRQWHHDTDEIPVVSGEATTHEGEPESDLDSDLGGDLGPVRRRRRGTAPMSAGGFSRRRSRGLIAGLVLLAFVAAGSAATAFGGQSRVASLVDQLGRIGAPDGGSTTPSPSTGVPTAVPALPAPIAGTPGSSADGNQPPGPVEHTAGRQGTSKQDTGKHGADRKGTGKHGTGKQGKGKQGSGKQGNSRRGLAGHPPPPGLSSPAPQ